MQIDKHWLNVLLDAAYAAGASDIHLSPNKPPIFRVAGQLRAMPHLETVSADSIRAWFAEQLPQHQLQENQQVNFAFNHFDTEQRVRVTVYQTTHGISLDASTLANFFAISKMDGKRFIMVSLPMWVTSNNTWSLFGPTPRPSLIS